MRMHHSGALVLAAVTVLFSASPSGMPAPAALASRPPALPSTRVAAVPAPYSFDDLAPTESAALARPTQARPLPAGVAKPPRPPRNGVTGSSPAAGTPQAVLAAAYRSAVSKSPRGCHLRVEHLAAIGQVESGSIGGRSVTAGHQVSPAIFGPLLDGGPFAVVLDTDDGSYDGDSGYDRAMGPLQFLPGTWSWAGRDGDGDGRRDPQNVFDAALATAGYLCHGGRDLSRSADLRSAVLSYNQSDEYHAAVVEWVAYFRQHGLAALTDVAFRVGSGGRASDLPTEPVAAAAKPKPKPSTAAAAGTGPQVPRPTATTSSPSTPPTGASPPPGGTSPRPTRPAPLPTTPGPTTPEPTPEPTTTDPGTPAPTTPDPTPTTAPAPDPGSTPAG